MKFIVPTRNYFGKLEFAGMGDPKTTYNNVTRKVVETHKCYNLYSDKLLDEGLCVYVTAAKNLKNFDYEQEVELINPRLEIGSTRSGERNYSELVLYADDIVPFGSAMEI